MNIIHAKGDLVRLAKLLQQDNGCFVSKDFEILKSLVQNSKGTRIIHGANCMAVMGAGLAKQLAEAFPKLKEEDMRSNNRNINKLGRSSGILLNADNNVYLINVYTQYYTGPCFNPVALIEWFLSNMHYQSLIIMPYIGCGIGGYRKEDLINLLNNLKEIKPDVNITIILVDYESIDSTFKFA